MALMRYTLARVDAATGMKVEDFYVQKRRGWVRLHEKGRRQLSCGRRAFPGLCFRAGGITL
jgi:hypothetical protein